MSALANMMVDMLLKELPPELREKLKDPQLFEKISNAVNTEYGFFKQTLIDIDERLKRIENVNSGSDGGSILRITGRTGTDD